MSKNLVIVESPAKAKTIEKFLGSDYKVTSSYGHIRDLQKNNFSIDIENNFTPLYEVPSEKKNLVENLKKEAKKAEVVWLASDEDREGEAISWHLYEVLDLKPENTRRIVFHEITKSAILHAIENPRTIDAHLVNAQQARRVLDRIVGFQLSPILWKKIKPSLSAGRVQSVAVRLIVDREREIKNFKTEESYRLTATFSTHDTEGKEIQLNAELSKRFKSQEEAVAFLERCKMASFQVANVTQKPIKRVPAPPFTTSTLQQEAARKLRLSVSQTMRIAQKLYESGLITYMRTDSVNLSGLALATAKEQILSTKGERYLHTRNYHTHSKGAQEAHEAIRPSYINRTTIEGTATEKRLYDLIWKRTVASQMADAEIEKTTIEIAMEGTSDSFIASGEVIKFDGFLSVYAESFDEGVENESAPILPTLSAGETLLLSQAEAIQRFSQRPPRFTEASLVKKMEELGIGRPSTYAPTISTIQAREYITRYDLPSEKREIIHLKLRNGRITKSIASETYGNDKGKLVPTDIGVIVNDFLQQHFPEIMEYDFTAKVEERFDEIAEGNEEWRVCIDNFYKIFHPLVTSTIEERTERKVGERILGKDPKTGHTVSVKLSRYGSVVQIGQPNECEKPLFAPLQKGQTISSITLEEAIKLFDLPKTLGDLEGHDVIVGVGRYGPYIKHIDKYYSLDKEADPNNVTLEEAVSLIHKKQEESKKSLLQTFEQDPSLSVLNGRFGPYLNKDGKNYKLPKGKKAETITYEECIAIITEAESAPQKSKPTRRYSKRKTKA